MRNGQSLEQPPKVQHTLHVDSSALLTLPQTLSSATMNDYPQYQPNDYYQYQPYYQQQDQYQRLDQHQRQHQYHHQNKQKRDHHTSSHWGNGDLTSTIGPQSFSSLTVHRPLSHQTIWEEPLTTLATKEAPFDPTVVDTTCYPYNHGVGPSTQAPKHVWIGFKFSRSLTRRERRIFNIVVEDKHESPVPEPAVKNMGSELWYYLGDIDGDRAEHVGGGVLDWISMNMPHVWCSYNIV